MDSPDRYFEALQQAGYATDPQYARKLKQVLRSDAIAGYSTPGKHCRQEHRDGAVSYGKAICLELGLRVCWPSSDCCRPPATT